MPAIWGGEAWMPEWDNEQTFTQFSALIIKLYNGVNEDLERGVYGPLFLSGIDPHNELMNVDDWCDGFLRGLSLWGELQPQQMQQLETCLYPIRHFCTEEGWYRTLVTLEKGNPSARLNTLNRVLNTLGLKLWVG